MIHLDLDELTGVLYAREEGSVAVSSDHAPHDMGMVLALESGGDVVGVTLLGADEVSSKEWREHQDRGVIPEALRDALDQWFLDHDG